MICAVGGEAVAGSGVHGLALYAFGDIVVLTAALLQIQHKAGQGRCDNKYYSKHDQNGGLNYLLAPFLLAASFTGGFLAGCAFCGFLFCEEPFFFPYRSFGSHVVYPFTYVLYVFCILAYVRKNTSYILAQ